MPSYASPLSLDLSPIRLAYVAALRGVVPRKPGIAFSYAQTGTFDPEALLCLAASNPEGRFYGLLETKQEAEAAASLAQARHVSNVLFGAEESFLPTTLDYLACDFAGAASTESRRQALFSLAERRLKPGGLLAYRYRAYANPDESLRFLIGEYAPELSPSQALEFLDELKVLGSFYFDRHPIARAALDKAIADKAPDAFFESCLGKEPQAKSGAFETMEGLLPRGFTLAGDADIGANYLELSVPPRAQEPLLKCKDHLLYEPIKDFAAQRECRNDIWVKLPVQQTEEKPALFGFFTFGITARREKIPSQVSMGGKEIPLTTPLFSGLIDLMCLLPLGVGDFLQHPLGKTFGADEVLSAIQILVACGVAQPMRGRYEGYASALTSHPAWANGFNAHLKNEETEILEPVVYLASPIVGGPLSLSAKEALVLQALCRVGLANISGSLKPTLEKLAVRNPSLAAQIMDAAEPTDEVVHTLVTTTLEKGMVRWYAYGLLAA